MEFVYVVPRSELFPECAPHGFQAFGLDSRAGSVGREQFVYLARERGFYVERERAERSPEWKQIIPYVVLARLADSGEPEVFLLRRTKNGGEARLHDKLSVGVGGHINPVDSLEAPAEASQRPDPLPAACRRELHEELVISGDIHTTPVGLLNDDTNPVGAVHVGLVEIAHVEGPVAVRETDQLEGSFTSLADLETRLVEGSNFESWSALLIPCLRALLISETPSEQRLSNELPTGRRVLDPSRASC